MSTASTADSIPAPSGVTPAERDAIRALTDRLTAAYASTVTAERVVSTIQTIYRGFATARIRDFVPLLVERAAIRELGTPTR